MNKLTEDERKEVKDFIKKNLAQESSSNDRFYPGENESHLGEEYVDRDEFSRDRDRIIYTKAFRRLQHKAQVYSNKKGDHFRTRLTHTLEVNQIAKSISKNLGLNMVLTEAIALGHDIGHTPFGHAGEEVLDNIMKGKDDLGGKLEYSIDYGGFKHNMNSIKILELLEEKNGEKGLNLTWQTLDGILKHTSIRKDKKDKKWDLKRFVKDYSNYEYLAGYDYFKENSYPNFNFPLTLEGQVVAIADEIAQREHDIDDSLRSEEFNFNELYNILHKRICFVKENINTNSEGYDLFLDFEKELEMLYSSSNELKKKEFFSLLISYFIIDVTKNTMEKINEIQKNDALNDYKTNDSGRKYIIKELIQFSEVGKQFNESIKQFIEKGIINSFNVSRFDGKGKYVLRQLFKAYYENPRQMPKSQLKLLKKNVSEILHGYPTLEEEFEDIPLSYDELLNMVETDDYFELYDIEELLDILKLNFHIDYFKKESYSNAMNEILKVYEKEVNQLITYQFDINDLAIHIFNKISLRVNKIEKKDIINNYEKDQANILLNFKGLIELHYVFLSIICDYIAQMTDDYALKEYKNLYLI